MTNSLEINFKKYNMKNGLDVTLYQNDYLPLVSVNLWYRVGSANEVPGKTGFAHLFEHMMFQGSENVDKEMHFKYIQEAGGSLNGSTSIDRTNYYETLPSNNLDLALWLESDRMGFMLEGLTQEKLDNQKSVVMNERRQRYDNQPYGRAWEILFANLFPPNHPYNWPTIGWMKDIEKFELNDVKNFFKTYYSPSNASLVIGGDIDINGTIKSVEKHFGDIPSVASVPPVQIPRFTFDDTKQIVHEDNVQLSRVYLAWHSDKIYGDDDAALDILSDVMAGSKNSRLHQALVHEKEIALDVSCFQYSGKYAGMFFIIATAKPEIDLYHLREEIFSEIKNINESGITKEEFLRAVNGVKSSFIYSLQNLESMTNQINSYNFYAGNPNYFQNDLKRYELLNPKLVQKQVEKYLDKPFVELHIVPKDEKE